MNDLIVFGSARTDAFIEVPLESTDELCNINTHDCYMMLSYASKISVDRVTFEIGGNGANMAVGTMRMGVDSLLAAELGQGSLADGTMRYLEKEIDTTYVTQTQGIGQGFGAAIMYGGERTILSYYSDHEPAFPENVCEVKWAYLTSVGEQFENYYESVYKWLKSCNAKLAFNPGGRQIKKGQEWLKKYLSMTELIFVNRKEAEEITKFSGESLNKEKELLKALANLGPKICVITDGGNGSFVYDGKKFVRAEVLPFSSFERTGAGDAFSTGCLSAIIKGKSLEEALLQGTINSTSVIGYVGPQKGLLTKKQLPEWFERAKSCKVEVGEF